MLNRRTVLAVLLLSLLLLSSSVYAARDSLETGTVVEEVAQGTITVTGRLSYYDSDNVKKPARGVTVWVMDDTARPFARWEALASGITDERSGSGSGPR